MSFYRTILAAVAAAAIASPVFADDSAMQSSSATQSPSAAAAPAQGSSMSQPSASTESNAATTETKVNINKASAKDLMKVKGINASKARAIVAYRKKHGDFKSLDDLAKVKGFTKMKAEDMKAIEDQLTIE
jgi:competence protein ComEA